MSKRVAVIGGMGFFGAEALAALAVATAAAAAVALFGREARAEARRKLAAAGPNQCACGVITAAGPKCRKVQTEQVLMADEPRRGRYFIFNASGTLLREALSEEMAGTLMRWLARQNKDPEGSWRTIYAETELQARAYYYGAGC